MTTTHPAAAAAPAESLLAVRGVKTFYGNIIALKGVDIDVKQGEIVTLIGANGAGKSTLMMTIFGKPQARCSTRVATSRGCRRMRSLGSAWRNRPRGVASFRG